MINFYLALHHYAEGITLLTQEWLASNFSLLYHSWIKYESHENRGNDHQPKQLLIVKQILLVSLLENSMEIMLTDVRV